MEIKTNYMTKNGLYNKSKIINVKGIILHSVGCAVDTAEEWWDRWNKPSYKSALVHGFIDDKKAIIAVPCMETKGKAQKAYHVANDSTHNRYLGFEMCEYGGIKYTGGSSWDHSNEAQVIAYASKTYKNAVELFAKLCTFHGLDPLADGVILSHHEAHQRGIASGHADVEHIWNYGDFTMDQFRKDVKAAMSGTAPSEPTVTPSRYYRVRKSWDDVKSQIGAFKDLDNAKRMADQNAGYTVFDSAGRAVYSNGAAVSKTVLKVDGSWGRNTTLRLQEIFGTTRDGIISNQWAMYKSQNPGLYDGWGWHTTPNGQGSELITAMQRWAGMAASDCDGEIGPATIKAIQRKMGTTQDGVLSYPSSCIKAIQKWANEQD